MESQQLKKIILIDASLIGDELVVDLNKNNKRLYKSIINDCLDVNEILSICDEKNIDYSFGRNDLFNPIIDVSFNYPRRKFYYDKNKQLYISIFYNAYSLDSLEYKNGIYKDENGKIIAVNQKELKEQVVIDGLNIKNGKIKIVDFETEFELRKRFYDNGFKVRYLLGEGKEKIISYKRYKRSVSSAKEGKCYFIREDLYDDMMKWTCLGNRLKPQYDERIYGQKASWEAYIALSLSGIEKSINIPLDSILFVKDLEYKFSEKCIDVSKNGNVLDANEKEVEINNKIWDGEGLLDEEVFEKNGYGKNGMLLLRNRFLKSCVFNTKLQKWFHDNGINSVEQLNGVTQAKRIEDIKLVITESSLKLLKFAYKIENQKILDRAIEKIWSFSASDEFGVVKHDKKTKFFGGKKVQATYQLLNTLPLDENDIKKLFKPAIDYYKIISSDVAALRYYLKMRLDDEYDDEENEEKMDYASFKEIVAFELLKLSDEMMKTKFISELLGKIRESMQAKLSQSKVLIDGTYATLFSNGYELLNYIIYKGNDASFLDNVSHPLKPGEIMCTHFKADSELLCSRNPHITMGNLYFVKNKMDDSINNYFNLSKTIVCVNSIGDNLMQRLNGADFDSDTMLITNDEILLNAAKKNYGRFLVPTNTIKTESVNYDLDKLDDIISNNFVGEIVNDSQTLNSIYWDIYHQDNNSFLLPELYKEICKLAVLSNIEIDKAKKDYQIDTKKAIMNIENDVKKLNIKMKKPNFLERGKENYKTSCCYVKNLVNIEKREKGEGKNKRIVDIINLEAKNVLFEADSCEEKIMKILNDEFDFFGNKQEDANQNNRNILDNVFDLIKDYLNEAFEKGTIKDIFERINKEYIGSKKSVNDEAPKTIYLLYFIYKLGRLKDLFKHEKVSLLKMDYNGKFEMYGYKFKKEEIEYI